MRYLPTGNWMQKADAHTIHEIGIPSLVLMERAALGIVEVIKSKAPKNKKILIVCGSGNNGGDGFAIARLLHDENYSVEIAFVGKTESMSDECKQQYCICKNIGISIATEIPVKEYGVIVDAIFGVGLCREISGKYASAIERLNAMEGYKVAVDIPSGVSSLDGKILGIAFKADLTVSVQCEKLGTVLYPGKDFAGEVVVKSIGINTELYQNNTEICYTLEQDDLCTCLPKRVANSHKGTYGKVLMITGSEGMAGAAYLSAKAAYVSGAGLVQIYTAKENRSILQQLLPEAIISTYTEYSEEELKQLLNWSDVVCIGCGLGQGKTADKLLQGVFQFCKVPCIIDADGINLLSERMELLEKSTFPIALTPHMKEMTRLLKCSIAKLNADRMNILTDFVKRYPVVCALKDARTLVAKENHSLFVNTAGNNAMAKAGSGDVLAGVITGLTAQHMNLYDSVVSGVYLHANGGDYAKKSCGVYSVLAEDLISGIKDVLKQIEQ